MVPVLMTLLASVAAATDPGLDVCFTDGQRLTAVERLEAEGEILRFQLDEGELRVPASGVVDCAEAPTIGAIRREYRFVRLGEAGALFALASPGENETELVLLDGTVLLVGSAAVASLGRDPDGTPVVPEPEPEPELEPEPESDPVQLAMRVCLSDGQVLQAASVEEASGYYEYELAHSWMRVEADTVRPGCQRPKKLWIRPGVRTWDLGASGRLYAAARPMGRQTEMRLLDGKSVFLQASAVEGVSELEADSPMLEKFVWANEHPDAEALAHYRRGQAAQTATTVVTIVAIPVVVIGGPVLFFVVAFGGACC